MLDFLGKKYLVSSNPNEILAASKIIFPGQGHFEQAMTNLNSKGLIEPIKRAISNGIPFLGICLGLQILFEKSEEAPNINGLGVVKGEVKKFQKGKTPQIGWNKITTTAANSYLSNEFFYFVNSYYVIPQNPSIIASAANYHIDFCASIQYKNLTAVQFHPEKSSDAGIEFFKKWLAT